jgi:hypothetical protein
MHFFHEKGQKCPKNGQKLPKKPTYNASNEKVTVAYGNFLAGASLRCVKNK